MNPFSFGALESKKDHRTINHTPAFAALLTEGGVDYLPSEIENQHHVGICFHGNTLIQMADTSMRQIRDIVAGDEVIDAFGNKQIVIKKMSRLWQGNMYEIIYSGGGDNIIVTPEHPFLTPDGNFKKVNELTVNDYVCIPYIKEVKDKTDFYYEKEDDFLKLLGLYLAEGCTEIYKDRNSGRVTFTLNIKETEIAKFIADTIKKYFRLNTCFYKKPLKNTLIVRISSRNLVDIFDNLAGKGANGKRIHKKFMLLAPEKQIQIFNGWALGDGSFRQKRFYGVSISKELIIQMFQILLRNHVYSNLRIRRAYKNTCNHKEAYELTMGYHEAYKIFPGQYPLKKNNGGNLGGCCDLFFAKKKIKKIKKLIPKKDIPVGTTVYNLETTGTHTYTANFVGVHNCTAIALVQEREKANSKKYSPDFQYLLQKKFYDLNWDEGSSLLNSLKVGKKFGFLPIGQWTYTVEADRSLPYAQYIAKLQAVPDAEVQRLIGLCVDKISGYALIDVNNPVAIAQAICESKAGIFCRYEIGTEWFNPTDPLLPPTPGQTIGGHAITMNRFKYD